MNKEYEKCFHEVHTDTFHKTLKAAKAAVSVADGKHPLVYRCWRKDGVIVGEQMLCRRTRHIRRASARRRVHCRKLKES